MPQCRGIGAVVSADRFMVYNDNSFCGRNIGATKRLISKHDSY